VFEPEIRSEEKRCKANKNNITIQVLEESKGNGKRRVELLAQSGMWLIWAIHLRPKLKA
jgi:hypothetical protein